MPGGSAIIVGQHFSTSRTARVEPRRQRLTQPLIILWKAVRNILAVKVTK
jgi:hypothetical protein